MPINPNIALQVRPLDLQDPLAAYGRVAAIQQAQNQNALAQYQLGKAQREDEQSRALNALYAGAVTPEGNVDYNKLIAGAGQQGMGSLVPGILKGQREAAEAQAKADKEFGAAVEQRMKASRQLLEGVSTPEQYIAWHEANHKDPVLSKFFAQRGITAADARGRIQDAINAGPEAFNKLLTESKIGAEKAAEQIAAANKPMSVAAGASVYDPVKGTFTQAPAAPIKPTPAETEEIVLRLQDPTLPPQLRKSLEARLNILTTREPKEPKEPKEPSAPVAVVDEATGTIKYVTREQALGKTPAAAIEALPPKEIQKREASYPQATSAIKGFETKSDAFIKDLKALRDDPGLDQITGAVYGRLGSVSRAGSRAQALYDKITAKGGFQALQDLRDASKTGGALGNVSNQEGKQLTSSFAAIDRRQAKEDVQAAIDQAIADIEGSKTRMREAYESTYSYKSGRGGAAAPSAGAAPAASKSGATVSNW